MSEKGPASFTKPKSTAVSAFYRSFSDRLGCFLFAISLLFLSSCRHDVPSIVKSYEKRSVFNGYLYVKFDGEVLYQAPVGNAFSQVKKPDYDSPLYLASLTKLFTKLAIIRLEKAGKLEFDQPISELRPDFEPDFGKQVSVRHLLEMTSGLPRELALGDSMELVLLDRRKMAGPYLDTISGLDLSYPPGEEESYSNLNYWLLGAIIEEAMGTNADDAFRKLIFEPLEMKHSGLYPKELKPLEAYSFQDDEPVPNLKDYSGRYTSGGAFSSVEDLAKLADALQKNYFNSEDLLFGENKRLEYYGSLPSASTVFIIDKRTQFHFIFLNNMGIGDLKEITALIKEVQSELGVKSAAGKKRVVRLKPLSELRDSVVLENAMLSWIEAVETGEENAILAALQSVSEKGAFAKSDATWKELSLLPQRYTNWKALGFRYVKETPAGYEVWFGAKSGEKMAIRWIASENQPDLISTIFIQPDDMEWMGKDY